MPITSSSEHINVQNLSGHSMSHRNTLTANVGTLVPILTEEVVPNTRCHLKTSFSVKLPPLASETFANIDYRIEAFFVPHRLLYRPITQIISGEGRNTSSNAFQPVLKLDISPSNISEFFSALGPGTLSDYLGFKIRELYPNTPLYLTPYPFLAYHHIYDYWYRNKLVQRSSFVYSTARNIENRNLFVTTKDYIFEFTSPDEFTLADGQLLFSLRQRNFDSDYFTTATTEPQLGAESSVKVDIANNSGSFSIASLRAANSLQQFAERNNLVGVDDVNFYKGMYGAHLDYGVAQHPVCLGSCSVPIYVNGIYQNSPNSNQDTNNPFMTVATQYGSGGSSSTEVIIKDFTAQEFGYIMVIGSLVPKVSYGTGVRRYLHRHISANNNLGPDFANPIMQNVGPQPIFSTELESRADFQSENIFGFQMRFADWITHPDEVHGEFVDGKSLSSFVLQRTFMNNDHPPVLSSSFLRIPTNYLDQIFAVSSSASSTTGFGYWVDMLHEWNISNPIADFIIPSLQDPSYEHGHEVSIHKNGAPMINN